MDSIVISTDGLSRSFGAVRAVQDLTMTVPAGIVFGFLGPNGSGKTTTIRLLLGLLEPTGGHAEVMGHDTRTQGNAIRACTGVLLEHAGLYERLSAEENLEFYGRVARLPVAARRARSKELLERLGLWERRREPVGGWSRGMKQKLAVARAMLHRPPLIFLDEPTAGLDPVAAAALREDLRGLVESQRATVFLTTHNLGEAEQLCAQVGVIRDGRLLAVSAPAQLRANAGGPRVEIHGQGLDDQVVDLLRAQRAVVTAARLNSHIQLVLQPGASPAPLIELLVGRGVRIEEVRKGAASLEQAFLALMDEDKKEESR